MNKKSYITSTLPLHWQRHADLLWALLLVETLHGTLVFFETLCTIYTHLYSLLGNTRCMSLECMQEAQITARL